MPLRQSKGVLLIDLIMLVGANPRYESTILNARIRKAFLNNNTKIISLNDVGDLTYPYKCLDGQTQTLNDIFEGTHELSKDIISSKKPMIIIGESLFRSKYSEFLFNKIKDFLLKNKKISDEWNSLNILSCDAATVGNFDLGIINYQNNLLNDLKEHKFDIVFMLGQDNIDFDKKNVLSIGPGLCGLELIIDRNHSIKKFSISFSI